MTVTGRVASATSSVTAGGPRSRSARPRSWSSGSQAPGSPSTTLADGRTATVIGIARRPYPSATDRRFAVTPRSPADVRVAGRADADAAGGGSRRGRRPGPAPTAGPPHRTVPSTPTSSTSTRRRPARAGRRARGRPGARWLHARRRHRDRPGRPARPGARAARPHRARRRAQRDRSGRSRRRRRHRRRRRSGRASSRPATPSPRPRPHHRDARRDRHGPVAAHHRDAGGAPVGSPASAARCRSMPGPPGSARWLAISAASVAVTLLRRRPVAAPSGRPDRRSIGHVRGRPDRSRHRGRGGELG